MWEIISNSYSGYFNYLINEILNPSWYNYFWYLIVISLTVWLLEYLIPWRKTQSIVRKDFWLDGFYLFFNFFIFSLVLYNALSNVVLDFYTRFLAYFGLEKIELISLKLLPLYVQFIIWFVIADFIQWNIHRLLHKNMYLWEFHKVHHSVKEMGFAAHFRFHWMETIIYKTLQYIPLSLIGCNIEQFFIIHIIALIIGHLNHSNINISYGYLKYIINNPKMHIWHHAKNIGDNKYGVNFGISLSVWDYLFGTFYLPNNGRDTELGFEEVEKFPSIFFKQSLYPFRKFKKNAIKTN